MLKKPTPEIEERVLAEYDRDYVKFCTEVFEKMEKSNPGMAEIFSILMQSAEENGRDFVMGLQMASVVYRQLEIASDGHLPIIEMREALKAGCLEALDSPKAYFNKYGTPYYRDGLITRKTLANFLGDASGHEAEPWKVVFVAILVIRLLEVQVELDLAKVSH